VADPGEKVEDCLGIVGKEVESLGMKLVSYDSQLGAHAMGKFRGEVLRDRKGIEDCGRLVKRLIETIVQK